jgi:hypothetical protein
MTTGRVAGAGLWAPLRSFFLSFFPAFLLSFVAAIVTLL